MWSRSKDYNIEVKNFVNSDKNESDYIRLFYLFLSTFLDYRSKNKSTALYPGEVSEQGKINDSIEGFYRFIILAAAWLSGKRDKKLYLARHGRVDVEEIIKEGILNAVNPKSIGYYGEIDDFDGKIIAASIISLSIWHLRNTLWKKFTIVQKEMVINWLLKVNYKKIVDNNWHLFIVLTNAVLKDLNVEIDEKYYKYHYDRHKQFYIGDGFYSDGPGGYIDYYNAWEVHPYLIWIDQIDPKLDRKFIRKTAREFLNNFIYYFSYDGFPIYGRSICYRLSLPTPFILAEKYNLSSLEPGTAKATLDAIWGYFLKNGAIENGIVAQGYFKNDYNILDTYSGSGSCNWSLISLACALSIPSGDIFWESPIQKLPIEKKSYHVKLNSIGFEVIGNKEQSEIILINPYFDSINKAKIKHYSNIKRIANRIICILIGKESFAWVFIPTRIKRFLMRPNNLNSKYKQKKYSSKRPFFLK